MPSWRHTLAVADRRVAAQSAVSAAAVAAPFAAAVSLGWVGLAAARSESPNWLAVGLGVAAVVTGAAAFGFTRRPSSLSTAVALDRHAGTNDAISSAAQLSIKPDLSLFERQAIADADVVAASANPAAAFPWRLRRPATFAAIAATMLTASAFVPAGWPAKAMQLAGLKKAPLKAEVQTALANAQAAEQLIRAVTPPAAQPTHPDVPSDAAQRTDPLADLRKQLEQGQVSPKDATQQAATAIERAADHLEQKAADAQAAQDLLRDRLALAQKSREDVKDDNGASEFTRAMKSGDIEKAAAEAERLAGAAENLSAQEKAKLADELKQLAQSINQAPGKPVQPSTDKPQPAPADKSRADQKSSVDQKPSSDKTPEPPSSQQQADQQARDLADKLKQASDELKEPSKPQPNDRQQQNAGAKSDQPQQANKPAGEQPQSNQPKPDSSPQPQQQPKPSDQNAGQPKPDQQQGQQQSNPQSGDQQQNQPKPGEDQQEGSRQPSSSDKPQDGKPETGGKPQSADKRQPGEKQQSGDRPQSADKQQAADKPQPQQGREGTQQQPQQQQGNQQPSPSQGGQSQQGDQPAGARPQDSQNQPKQAQQSAQPKDGDQPKPGDQQGTQPQADQRAGGTPNPGQQPDANPQSGEGTEPSKVPDKLPSLDRLRDKLKDFADQRRQSQQDRQDAQKLREQAQKLWENATPEQRKQMEQLARELAQRNAGKQEPGDQPQPRNSGGQSDRPDKPQEPRGLAGASDQPDAPDGRGPGNGPAGNKPTAPAAASAPTTTHDLDARSRGEDEAPSRVIAEWLTNKPSPRTGQPGGAASADVARAVEQSRQNAEQALQQRTVPARLTPLIRRYFDRLPQAVGVGGAEAPPTTPPAPAPAPAPSTKP